MIQLHQIFSGTELQIAEKIRQRRLQMLVHSCIYYKLNDNLVDDTTWSRWAVELAELQKQYPLISAKVDYAKAFRDWDGSSGAFLPLDDAWVVNKANQLLGRTAQAVVVNQPKKSSPKVKPKVRKRKLF